ncbi:hypothetical protein Pryu01_00952 [Paraliobacillus ryukyuensis]|uniref:Lysophospholipase L1-like esterase n=1 Tax=Paraliobacillus ryukyuensis TaxID=200904 RepID=A0A366EEL9_9BACI|nr:SGNH/GDSL hydrolase family protein [Paraliobacillus ryukyuensis]RBP00476.1 lysophospholipase L1-like esterase [Paraliobacillus ryukyuensis]
MKRKKRWILFVIVAVTIAIIIGLLILFQSDKSNETADIEPEQNIEEVIQQVQEKDEEVEAKEENNISSGLKNAVENTLGLFVHNNYNIVAIGDSLTQGVGDTTNSGGYVGVLEKELSDAEHDVVIDNYGKRGNRSDQLLKRLEDENIRSSLEEADMILLTIGANDIMKVVKDNFMDLQAEPFKQERVSYQTRLQEIFDTMLELSPDANIYLIGFYNPFEGYFENIDELDQIVINWNQTAQSLTETNEQLHYIPTRDLFQLEDIDLLADDNFHPNPTGYTLMGERILTHIRPQIEAALAESESEGENQEEDTSQQ